MATSSLVSVFHWIFRARKDMFVLCLKTECTHSCYHLLWLLLLLWCLLNFPWVSHGSEIWPPTTCCCVAEYRFGCQFSFCILWCMPAFSLIAVLPPRVNGKEEEGASSLLHLVSAKTCACTVILCNYTIVKNSVIPKRGLCLKGTKRTGTDRITSLLPELSIKC